ncbi:MAG TPA: methionyl-tRNA formyltransferase [Candidatus Acidoferrales bacterium]|nr:methionyl-tRNA formyltransferase [Candidatus Acidoferrales bacterium]
MRVVFCGTPEIGIPALRALLSDARFRVIGVITQPDRPRGRGLDPGESPIKQLAREAALEVFQPEKIRAPEAQQWIETKAPDAAVLIAYGQILPARLLSIPRLGWINLHASLLPKYRGAAPIAWAIANGETRTGITTMQIDAGMDTGPLLLRKEMEIGPDEAAPELAARMAIAGAPLVVESLEGLDRGTLRPEAQETAQASYAPLLKREDGRIRWELAAQQIYNRMRGLAPWPGTFAEFRGSRVHLWGRPAGRESASLEATAPGSVREMDDAVLAACGAGTWLEITEAQPEGRRRMSAAEFARGARLARPGGQAPGERFQ